jgi:hypothetical protein
MLNFITKDVIVEYLEGLALDFDKYFLADVTKYSWMNNPFGIDIKTWLMTFQT